MNNMNCIKSILLGMSLLATLSAMAQNENQYQKQENTPPMSR